MSACGRAPRRRGLPVEEDSTRRVVDADADPPAIWGRPRERGSNRHEQPLDPPGQWARHVGRVIRVIGGDPFDARVAASTSQQAAALAGGGQGRATVEARESRRGGGAWLFGGVCRWGGGGGWRWGWEHPSRSRPLSENGSLKRKAEPTSA